MADLVTLGLEIEARGGARARQETDSFRESARRAGAEVDRLEDQTRQLTVAQTAGADASRRMAGGVTSLGLASRQARASIQNASFQIQDIITQITLGVPVTRALAIQLPQLLGGFGAVGAAAGVAVGLVGALASSFFDTADAVDAAGDGIPTLEGRLKSLTEQMESLRVATFDANQELFRQAGLAEQAAGLERSRVISAIQDQLRGIRGAIPGELRLQLQAFGINPQTSGRGFTANAIAEGAENTERINAIRGLLPELGAVTEQIDEIRRARISGPAQLALNERITEDRRLGRGGGSSRRPDPTFEELFAAEERLTEQRFRLSRLTDDQAAVLEERIALESRFRRELGDLTPAQQTRIALMAEERAAIAAEVQARKDAQREADRARRLRERALAREALAFQRDFVDPIASSLENVLLGVRSFSDGLNAIALDIAGALIRRNVSQPLVEGLSGALSNVIGGGIGEFFAGSFAGGGFTGSGPRSGGIDGRGGFPAILHPNETVIDHSSGGGASVVVNIRNEGGGMVDAQQNGNQLDVVIKAAARDVAQGGPMFNAISKTFGIRPQLQRRA